MDLPGFGRSAKPAQFDYSIDGYGDWLDAFRRELGWDRYRMLVHDWGASASRWRSASPSGSTGS